MATKQIDYTSVPYSSFLDYVVPYVPGVPQAIAERCIRDAIIDFCDETKIYEQVLDTVFVPAGTIEFVLEVPNGTKLAAVNMLTTTDGVYLEPLSGFVVRHDIVELTASLPSDSTIYANVALKPSRGSINCPSFILEDWVDVIANGAQAMLFSMANEEWASTRDAANKYSLYRVGVAKARRYARTGKIVGNTRVIDIDLS